MAGLRVLCQILFFCVTSRDDGAVFRPFLDISPVGCDGKRDVTEVQMMVMKTWQM